MIMGESTNKEFMIALRILKKIVKVCNENKNFTMASVNKPTISLNIMHFIK